ncbi:unnamed protein product [Echinostoma caproni]|uniref:Uncharacterized protein n=1 Tax=Echinostoma caproni TaxID=27848 RepID=A0A183A1M9_9TREM|nr:unnamed protein product [Echinostoma caproni]
MGHSTYRSMYQLTFGSTDAASRLDPCTGMEMVQNVDTDTWLWSTDAASRLDPCTGMEMVEKVIIATWLACATELSQLSRMKTETATWLACATELSQLSRMKMESDIKKEFRRVGSEYLSKYVPNSAVFHRCSFEAGSVY